MSDTIGDTAALIKVSPDKIMIGLVTEHSTHYIRSAQFWHERAITFVGIWTYGEASVMVNGESGFRGGRLIAARSIQTVTNELHRCAESLANCRREYALHLDRNGLNSKHADKIIPPLRWRIREVPRGHVLSSSEIVWKILTNRAEPQIMELNGSVSEAYEIIANEREGSNAC